MKEKVVFIAVILSLCILGILLRPKSSNEVETIFAEALIYNDIDSAKRVSSPEIWPLLDSWLERHKAIPNNCKFPSDSDVGTTSVSNSFEENKISSSYVIGRECPEEIYTIVIHDIALRKIDNRWKVISWGEYCESSFSTREFCLEPE